MVPNGGRIWDGKAPKILAGAEGLHVELSKSRSTGTGDFFSTRSASSCTVCSRGPVDLALTQLNEIYGTEG